MKHKFKLPKKDILVISFCAAFLVLTLGAVTNRGRTHAKMIICQMNQKHLANAAIMFANDNEGKLFEYGLNGLWITPLEQYAPKNELRYCPSTDIVSTNNTHTWGSSHISWAWNWGTDEPESGSYAFNSWLYTTNNSSYYEEYFKTLANVQHPDLTPIFGDSLWVDSGARDTDTCPADFDLNGNPNYGGRMSMYLLNRHFDRINVSFIDGHAEAIELKELWSLTWHRDWNIQHNKTREDGTPIYPQE